MTRDDIHADYISVITDNQHVHSVRRLGRIVRIRVRHIEGRSSYYISYDC